SKGTGNFLEEIQFRDSNLGWCVGEGILLKTTDGGTNWTELVRPPNSGFWYYSLHFLNDNDGYVGGTGGNILKTTDGGQNWTVFNYPTFYGWVGIRFADFN